jgi:hypothetical protein
MNEISPLIPPKLIKIFNDNFGGEKDISQPEEVNGLEKITIYNPEKKINVSIYEEPPEEEQQPNKPKPRVWK